MLLLIRQLGSFSQFQWRYQVAAGEDVVVVVVDGRIVVVVVVGAVEGGVVDNVVVLEELVVSDMGVFAVGVDDVDARAVV